MFRNPFSFDGRIRRTEYGLSFVVFFFVAQFINVGVNQNPGSSLFVLHAPGLWFIWAQGAKRCHDMGMSGWWQVIPFSPFWLIFTKGTSGPNEYGPDPKNRSSDDAAAPQVGPLAAKDLEREAAEQAVLSAEDTSVVEISTSDLARTHVAEEPVPAQGPPEPTQQRVPERQTSERPKVGAKWLPLLIALVVMVVVMLYEYSR